MIKAFLLPFIQILKTYKAAQALSWLVQLKALEEKYLNVEAQPAHKLAVPLFILTSIPYFITLAYDFLVSHKPDTTFAWFGVFYLGLGGIYLAFRLLKRKTASAI